ncbi:N-acetylglucosamine-6-phosphate deacetylase [Oceanobacillus longus]|uniref:N-acetylglucosamine-6-phosphate deacetylase n=1 Tax=Oceanobacillus longus TaxID=930120 RepID=A0ABV8GYY7_9BACI
MFVLKGDIVTNGSILNDAFVQITDSKITYVGDAQPKSDAPLYEVNGFICPGFTDIHIHGVDGFDFMDKGAFQDISALLPKYGVTSYLATSRTAPISDIRQFLEEAKLHSNTFNKAKMLGVHLEGPWISPSYSGAQSKDYIRKFSKTDLEELIMPYAEIINKITLAPEELDDFSNIKALEDLDIQASAGHTNATIEEIGEAIAYGLRSLTHTFNAMSPIHHRTPGTAAAALYYDDLFCEIITDGVHIHPMMIELLYRTKRKEKMILISDCTGYNKLPDGAYDLRGKELKRTGNQVTLKNGTLAGSAITLDKGIKYVVENCHIPLADAVFMATETPISVVGTEKKLGRIEAGYEADLVILDRELEVEKTIINGKLIYEGV